MIPCFRCKGKRNFPSLDQLLLHFDLDHNMSPLDSIECGFNFCPRVFTTRKSFKKHFYHVHRCEISDTERPASSLEQNTDDSTSDIINDEFHNYCPISTVSGSNEKPNCSVEPEESPVLIDKNIDEALEAKIFFFCSNMYSHVGIPMVHAQTTINLVQDLIQGINNAYKHKLLNFSCNSNSENATGMVQKINEAFTFVEKSVQSYRSKHRTLKILKEKGFFFPPKLEVLGFTPKRRKFKKRFCVVPVKETSAFIPLRHVFRTLFEQEGVLPKVLQYLEVLKSENVIIENVVQGECWKSNVCKDKDGIVLPIFLNNDCIEVGSALSGHSGIQKLNATFCSIPCLLPEMRASLKNIFLILLTKSSNLKRFGNKIIFKSVIQELNFLSRTGILVKLPDGQLVRMYFQVCTVIGDNLGLNSIGGFVRNFSTSQYCCRLCRYAKVERQFYTKELLHLLRTIENYATDLIVNDYQQTGIRERCTFNDLFKFHIITNGSVDVTHDLFEGIVQYVLCFMLKYYIYEKKIFSLATLNDRISKFNYGSADISNRPPPISESFRKKSTLKMSASETACLFKYFGLLLSDLIPVADPVWEIYIALRKVVEVTMSTSVDLRVCELLASYISEFLLLYISLARKPLVFKFHNLIHYPRLMAQFGPLVHLSTIRFESKNRILKISANAVACKRNICLTVARKMQLQLSHDFFCKTFSRKNILTGPNEERNIDSSLFDEVYLTTSLPDILKDKHTIQISWLEINGTRYCEMDALYVEVHEATSLPIFGSIKKIFLSTSGEVFFLLRNFRTISFKDHSYAFELEFSNSYSIVNYEKLIDFHPHSAISILGDNFYVTLLSRV